MKSSGLVIALIVSFVIGFVIARQNNSSLQPLTHVDEFVAKIQADLDASGKQVVMEVWTVLQMLKDAVKEAPVPPTPMPEFEKKIHFAGERAMSAMEVTIIQAFIGAVEKTVVKMPEWDDLILARTAEFFKVDVQEIKSLRSKRLTWSSVITGYGIAKATGKSANEVFTRYEIDKAWSTVALHFNLKPQTIGKVLEGFFPQ